MICFDVYHWFKIGLIYGKESLGVGRGRLGGPTLPPLSKQPFFPIKPQNQPGKSGKS